MSATVGTISQTPNQQEQAKKAYVPVRVRVKPRLCLVQAVGESLLANKGIETGGVRSFRIIDMRPEVWGYQLRIDLIRFGGLFRSRRTSPSANYGFLLSVSVPYSMQREEVDKTRFCLILQQFMYQPQAESARSMHCVKFCDSDIQKPHF